MHVWINEKEWTDKYRATVATNLSVSFPSSDLDLSDYHFDRKLKIMWFKVSL